MNATEARFADTLDILMTAGRVRWWAFEGMKFRAGGDSYSKVDFVVQLSTGEVVLYEVKGYMTEAGRLRAKAVAAAFPFRFCVVRAKKGGATSLSDAMSAWDVEVIGPPKGDEHAKDGF